MQRNTTQAFYDSLAQDYHLVYQNWEKSIRRQAQIIDDLIGKYAPQKSVQILDCTCGIGTQSLGLSQLGYAVTGTDLSPTSIRRAQQEAQQRELSAVFQTADLRQLDKIIEAKFGVVISFDNSLPHLLKTEDLFLAAQNVLNCMAPQGLFIGSIRDYNQLLAEKPQSTKPVTGHFGGQKMITFQTWDWTEDNNYTVNHFTLKEGAEGFNTKVRRSTYRAYTRQEVQQTLASAGFSKVQWLMPSETAFYQPIFLAFN